MFVKYVKRYKDFVDGNKHLWVTLGYFLLAVFMTFALIYFPGVRKTHALIFIFFNILMLVWPILIVVSHVISFRTTLCSIRKLASLYLQIIVMFGVIYYFASAVSAAKEMKDYRRQVPIKGIDANWVKMAIDETENKGEILIKALISFQDCIHFSLITSTTVGYGDTVPLSPFAKLMADIQILVSCFLLAFGVGSFFNSDRNKLEKKLDKLATDMEKRLLELENKSK